MSAMLILKAILFCNWSPVIHLTLCQRLLSQSQSSQAQSQTALLQTTYQIDQP